MRLAPKHFWLKVLSIGVAGLLWLLVAGERTVERAVRIPLEFSNLPPSLEIVGDAPTAVDVRLRGPSGTLGRLPPGELAAMLDVRAARPGRRLFHLTGADVRTPFGVEVVQVMPANVSLVFEPSDTKVVPIVPSVEGDPADGYVVGTVAADPATVEVTGPVSVLKRLTEAITEPVMVTAATGPVVEDVNVGVPDQAARLRLPLTARVTVQVAAAPLEWALTAVPVRIVNSGNTTARIRPATVTVHVRGPRDTMGSAADSFEAAVDVSGLRPGEYQLPVRVVPPARIGLVRVEPERLRVTIR